jgi:hypothetical protein
VIATEPSVASTPPSPYVGPRAFRDGELFFGRERDTAGVVNTLVAGRIVLLHSPSGAGKTSLVQAAVLPAMAKRNFQICAQLAPRFAAVRVNAPLPEALEVENRYVASAVLGLAGHLVSDPAQLRGWTIARALEERRREQEAPEQQLLVMDQFEEILTTDPTDFEGQRTFFRQLGDALDDDDRWALLAMREDYMGGLDRFLRYIPGQLRSTYRLDLLDTEGALRAVQLPAREHGVDFVDEAAWKLISDLRMILTGGTNRDRPRSGIYVEPVLLQVVCDSLWRKLGSQGDAFTTISAADVDAFGPLDTALRRYYSFAVRKASGRDPAVERAVRDWIQERLLTKQGLRSQTRTQPQVADPATVLRLLQERYLIRDDPRPNAIWWELSHDRLAEPILEDNRTWRARNLEPWQLAAYQWHRARHDESYLLTGEAYREARSASRKVGALTEIERDFLERSAQAVAKEGGLNRAQARIDFFRILLVVSLGLNLLLLLFLVFVAMSN